MVLYDLLEESYASGYGRSGYESSANHVDMPAYTQSDWSAIAESTMPLRLAFGKPDAKQSGNDCGGDNDRNIDAAHTFRANVELRSKQLSHKVIVINLISLLVNLVLALIAFYFSFTNNSPSTTAFAVDCVLDFISSAILLWRYYGDISSVYMQAREQIACIYLGALFVISSLAIIIKSISDINSGSDLIAELSETPSYELVYLASAATLACCIITVFKCALYKLLRDDSILLDVINTIVSTVFAMSIVMSQALINVEPTFWYLDPVLGIVLALFMLCFGVKVIHQNYNVISPFLRTPSTMHINLLDSTIDGQPLTRLSSSTKIHADMSTRLTTSSANRSTCAQTNNWQKADYSSIKFT